VGQAFTSLPFPAVGDAAIRGGNSRPAKEKQPASLKSAWKHYLFDEFAQRHEVSDKS
jgi:hypothetical protein